MHARRVLVTGAGGFIGRYSVAALRAAGYEVHAWLSARAGRAIPAQLQGAELHFADLFDPSAVAVLLGAVRPTHLLHFAWIAAPGVYWSSADNFQWLLASQHLMRAFHAGGGVRAVMAGSCAEYDWRRAAVCEERSSPLADTAAASPYAKCKIAMQKSLDDFSRSHGLSAAWGRIFFLFGPGEHAQRLVPSVITHLLSGREALCSHGRQVRSFLHVADVAAAFSALLDSDLEGPVNIGSGQRTTIGELLNEIAGHIGRVDLLRLGARAAGAHEPPILVPSIDRLRHELRWQPRWPLADGLIDTIQWWRGELHATGGEIDG